MNEFKCISCGAIKESENPCSCPACGYRMFQVPYDRKDILISEIENFISRLEAHTVERDDLAFTGKSKDDSRFPDYDTILKYVTKKDRTEDFLNNLLETVEQLRIHFNSQFSKIYPISFENLDAKIKRYDEVLLTAAQIMIPGNTAVLEPIEWGEASLVYTEIQNKYLWFSASELLCLIEKLAKKINRFIRSNNLYGNVHKYCPEKCGEKYRGKIDFKDELENAISEIENILNKQYVVDIADDGSDELKEMLTCIWHSIELIMCAPLFIETFEYLMGSERINETDFLGHLSDVLERRYTDFNNDMDITSFLNNNTEDELFELYKKLIGIDEFGFLVPIGAKLVNIGESEKKLDRLIGLSGIKESIKKIKTYALTNKDSEALNIHMCFYGNPGTGKTEVARIIAGILYENKILPTDKVVEVDRSGLVSQYFGATAAKTQNVIQQAMGGVLFIDEAYALANNSGTNGLDDYGKEAIDALVKAMEDFRGKFCVIFAGYRNEMLKMISTNPGMRSRVQFELDFPNYSRDELRQITSMMLRQRKYTITESALDRILDITDVKRKDPNFANAREIRNIADQVIMCQNLRRISLDDCEIGIVDINRYIEDAKINLPASADGCKGKILSGEEELDQLIGLENVKRMIKKIKAYAKRNKDEDDFNLHMCFYGNPGTGKTEVARILSRVLYDAGVLPEAKLVETDSHGLIGKFVGETAPKTLAKINDAMNGVLFIDEAYGLLLSDMANYGNEAISVLLKEMEDHRGKFCVIFAGYKEEMKEMISANPGLESRIQFTLEFPDYTREELSEIAALFLKKKKYVMGDSALDLFLDVIEYYRRKPNFANARTVRNVLDQVIMNQNLRTEDLEDNNVITVQDIEDYLLDAKMDFAKADKVE